jgi:hypothetical protein
MTNATEMVIAAMELATVDPTGVVQLARFPPAHTIATTMVSVSAASAIAVPDILARIAQSNLAPTIAMAKVTVVWITAASASVDTPVKTVLLETAHQSALLMDIVTMEPVSAPLVSLESIAHSPPALLRAQEMVFVFQLEMR